MRKLLRGAYNKKYLDCVCVDAIGDILTPKYISSHFKVILAKNGLKKIRFHDFTTFLRVLAPCQQSTDEDDSRLAWALGYEYNGKYLQPR